MEQGTAKGTGKYERLLERCLSLEPVPTAVAHPSMEAQARKSLARGTSRVPNGEPLDRVSRFPHPGDARLPRDEGESR